MLALLCCAALRCAVLLPAAPPVLSMLCCTPSLARPRTLPLVLQAIVDAILVLIRDIPEAKEMGLAQLCEFIEVRRGAGWAGPQWSDVPGPGAARAPPGGMMPPWVLALPLGRMGSAPAAGWQCAPTAARTTHTHNTQDCEFTFLSVQILHLLGEEGPRAKEPGCAGGRCWGACAARARRRLALHLPLPRPPPSPATDIVLPPNPPCAARYIRYIYNRVILENATVRAAALASLARFGAHCPDLRDRVLLLLKRALYDNDDEVGAVCVRCVCAVCAGAVCGRCVCVCPGRAGSSAGCAPGARLAAPAPCPPCLPPPLCPAPQVQRPRHAVSVPAAAGRRRAQRAWTRSGASPPRAWRRHWPPTCSSPTRSSPLTWCAKEERRWRHRRRTEWGGTCCRTAPCGSCSAPAHAPSAPGAGVCA